MDIPLNYHLSSQIGALRRTVSDFKNNRLLKMDVNDITIEEVCSKKDPVFLKRYFLAKRELLKKEYKVKLFKTLIELVGEEKAFPFLEELADKDEYYFDVDSMAEEFKQIIPFIRVKQIRSLSEYSVDDLEREKDVKYVEFESEKTSEYMIYSRNEYIRIRNAFDDLLKDVPIAKKGDAKSEYEVYKILNDRISEKVKYHKGSSSKEIREERSLLALPNGQGVCLGKSRVLQYACMERNVDTHVIFGFIRDKRTDRLLRKLLEISAPNDGSAFEEHQKPDVNNLKIKLLPNTRMKYYERNRGGHAWTQTKIGGEWFNGDITNLNKKRCLLFSDDEFNKFGVSYFYENNSFADPHQPCQNSFAKQYQDLIKYINRKYDRRIISLSAIKRVIDLYRANKSRDK